MQETNEVEPAKVEELIEVVNAAKLMTKVVTTAATPITIALVRKASAPRRRRGVIIQDPEEAATALEIVQLERKPVTEAHARKNMMVYLKNMAGFKMDFFKGEKEIEEEESKRKSENLEQRAAEKQKINEETEELKTHLQIIPNDEDDVYTEATPLALKLVRERFQSSEPKNFSDDFLLNTLKVMFEKPNVEASIWRNQREVKEESEMSLELLRLVRRQQQEGYKPE
uniref:Uncharacterized protein n=1 Tax=Tanacetum cinerariifolium TaxID=118510 RepID=A0A6L2KJM3_TANCI|nr:hypothetical protein [Tanacetum cinerariifolium]